MPSKVFRPQMDLQLARSELQPAQWLVQGERSRVTQTGLPSVSGRTDVWSSERPGLPRKPLDFSPSLWLHLW
jgi:hypothetical protein